MTIKEKVLKEAYKKAYGYWDNEYLREHDFCIKRSIKFGVEEALAEVSKVIGEGCGERFKHKSADRMPCNSFHLCPSCKIIKQKLGIK